MGLFRVPASRGLILLTASAIRTHFDALNLMPALHFSGITMGIANEHAKRLRIPAQVQERLIENVWPYVLGYLPELRELFSNFAVYSVKAMEIWASASAKPQQAYFEQWFSQN